MIDAFLGIQIIATLFALFMIYVLFVHYKQSNLNSAEFFFWLILWLAFIYFALFPKVLDPLLARLFIVRRMDLLMIVAFMILSYLGFQNHIGIKQLQQRIRQLVQTDALKKSRK